MTWTRTVEIGSGTEGGNETILTYNIEYAKELTEEIPIGPEVVVL